MKRIGQTRIEWMLLGIIALLCLVLSFLQYRWTGELSRAEPALLRAGLNDQVRRLVQAFNEEIQDSCAALLPTSGEIHELGAAGAHSARFKRWASAYDRSLFQRIGVATPEQGALRLYDFGADGRLIPAEWPPEWFQLRSDMSGRLAGQGRPPSAPPDSNIIELPVFEQPSPVSPPGREIGWMIFNLDLDHVRKVMLPRLVADYLNPGASAAYDVSVSSGRQMIFSTRTDGAGVTDEADATAGIFSGRSRWTIAVRHREGSLAAAVSKARWRNLLASLILVGLLGGTAWALVRYTARSRRLSEMQFRFAAGVSHDLRTPLTAIRGASFNLLEGVVQEPAAVRRYLKLILRNAEDLTSMIENVLAFSASMNAGTEARRERLAIGELLQYAVDTMTPEVEQASCRMELEVAPVLPPVTGDRIAVELMFRNLIGNAVRHGGVGKWIGVSAIAIGDGVEVRVSDRGPGIPESEQQRIFEPFFRGEQTKVRQVSGTGLGLSLVKNTVERHGGSIEVHNVPTGGAQFTVRFPAVA